MTSYFKSKSDFERAEIKYAGAIDIAPLCTPNELDIEMNRLLHQFKTFFVNFVVCSTIEKHTQLIL